MTVFTFTVFKCFEDFLNILKTISKHLSINNFS